MLPRNVLGVGCRFLGLICLFMALQVGMSTLFLPFQDMATVPRPIVVLQIGSELVALALLAAWGTHLLMGGRIVQRLESGGAEETPSKEAEPLFVVLMKLCGVWLIVSGVGAILYYLGLLTLKAWQDIVGTLLLSAVLNGLTVALGFYLLTGGRWIRQIAFGRSSRSLDESATPGR